MSDYVFPAGTPLTLTSGAYSSFGVVGQIVTIRELDMPAAVKAYRAETNPDGEEYEDKIDEFVAWLVVKEFAMPMAGDTVHLGDYSTFEEEFTS